MRALYAQPGLIPLLTGLGAVGAGGHDQGLGDGDGEHESGPEIAPSIRATSRTEQAIGPSIASA